MKCFRVSKQTSVSHPWLGLDISGSSNNPALSGISSQREIILPTN